MPAPMPMLASVALLTLAFLAVRLPAALALLALAPRLILRLSLLFFAHLFASSQICSAPSKAPGQRVSKALSA